MMFTTFLAANSVATYIRHISVGKTMIKCQGALTFFEKLGKKGSAVEFFDTAPLYDQSLYTSSEDNIVSLMQATDALVEKFEKSALTGKCLL